MKTFKSEESEEHATLFQLSLDLHCVASFDGYFKRLNPAWTRTLGFSLEELRAKPWHFFVHPEDEAATRDAAETVRNGANIVLFENRYRCKDGSYRWLQWQCVPSPSEAVVYGVARDVTEQRQTQDALRELSNSVSITLRAIGDGVISTDAAGRVASMNPVAERLSGWREGEACGKRLRDALPLVHPETRAPLESPVAESIRTGAHTAVERRAVLLKRDGSQVHVASSYAPILDEDGSIRGAVLVIRDVSEEEKAKKAHELLQRQLMVADRMASVGTLAAGVAHEVNNPLSYILSNLATLLEEIRTLAEATPSEHLRELEQMAADAKYGAERIRKIVHGLMTFSRVQEERTRPIQVEPVLDLSSTMVFNEIRHRARLVKDYGDTPLVNADDARLGQVFINLLVNATQSLPDEDAANHEIRLTTRTDAVGNAIVEVHDTGPGIPGPLLSRIFEPFFTTKPVGIGTGLGLSICHNIIQSMNGDIAVESRPGIGTTFRITLPGFQATHSSSPPHAERTAFVPAPLRGAVLVVDDEEKVGTTLRRVLKNHDVSLATSAKAALGRLDAGERFDVILCDLMMPEMNGMEFHESVSRHHPDHVERLLFITGGAFTRAARAFLNRCTNEHLEKPFDVQRVRDVVNRYVRLSRDTSRRHENFVNRSRCVATTIGTRKKGSNGPGKVKRPRIP